ncbi:hypothetical protein Rhopal_000435-T1 [Rhodotorula paludigena]|uniref:Uncharacterized protein n=1 Tax=Rhodotorula paludigena TaxID=86838 RepID=A0AAV5G4W0_9BASI|nr:hypothetical protein Rhopal_000435-T1 [Rhodotorula paludigena]
MASSSPPPPPDPNRLNPFASGCAGSPASSPSKARPSLRRSKTLANPESPTRWRREPLLDVTNAVLGAQYLGRLQRVPVLDDLLPSFTPGASTSTAENTPSSPTPSRILRRSTSLRRTRSAAPNFAGGSSSSPSNSLDLVGPLPSAGLASPSPAPARELRPRLRPAAAVEGAPNARRASRTGSTGGGAPVVPLGRRRTLAGATLPAVIEDEPLGGVVTPTTRARSEADDASSPASERRLRRRRTVGGELGDMLDRAGPSSSPPSSSSSRRGLR